MSGARESGPCVHEIVLGAVGRTPRRLALHAGIVAAVLHAGGVALALTLGAAPEVAAPKRESRPLVMVRHVVELEPPAPPAPAALPPEPVAPKPPPRVKQKAPEPAATPAPAPEPVAEAAPPQAPEPPPEQPPSEPPPAAQAGQVVAAAAGSAPAFALATGAGSGYAGGTTSAHGTGTQANHTGQAGKGDGAGLSRARGAQVRSRSWPCGWPPEAEELDLEEAFVVVRASVQPDGSLGAMEVLSDPGYGFGKRALWCARTKVKFDPALDAAGQPIAGVTPPLRVRFVRDE